jgi:hypothetical protein
MLGRKNYTREELDHARSAVDQQLAAYRTLVEAIDGATPDPRVTSALEAFEPLFLNNLTLALDRYFVHRVRMVTGKDRHAGVASQRGCSRLIANSPSRWRSAAERRPAAVSRIAR